ncbi:MAG: peptidoglycan editing factor PgeF [Bacteroidota bacterium]
MIADDQLFIRPALFDQFPELVAAESTRYAGNLGLYTSAPPETIIDNRQHFFTQFGIRPTQVAGARQVHGIAVYVAQQGGQVEGYDALISNQAGIFVSINVADCTPVLVYDPIQGAVAAVHAGWRGTVGKIAYQAILAMQEHFGTRPADCFAYIGTCIDECDFEVDEEVAAYFDNSFKKWDKNRKKFLIDLKKTNLSQLTEAGLNVSRIEISPYSTVQHNAHFFSHRFEKGKTGRALAIIGRK